MTKRKRTKRRTMVGKRLQRRW